MMFWVLMLIAGCWWEIDHSFPITPVSFGIVMFSAFCAYLVDKHLADWM